MAGRRALCGLLLAICCLQTDAASWEGAHVQGGSTHSKASINFGDKLEGKASALDPNELGKTMAHIDARRKTQHAHNVGKHAGLCDVSTWSGWSKCSTSCGRGMMGRERTVEHYGRECPPLAESKECMTHHCPIDCKMTSPTKWSFCSKTCGGGFKSRRRSVAREPLHGGKVCPDPQEFQYCNKQMCAVDCLVNKWSGWGTCSKSCGGGTKRMIRSVVRQKAFGGAACPAKIRIAPCNEQECIKHCRVSKWKLDLPCTRSCGAGIQRHRRDVVRKATYRGKACPVLKKYSQCNKQPCPIDCKVSEFSQWQHCSKTCGGGIKLRHRSALMTNAFGGKACPALEEEQSCNSDICPTDCQVTKFGEQSACDKTCGGGERRESRSILVRPKDGGKACPHLVEAIKCNKHACPIDCVMSDFSEWFACDKTCGGGTKWRGKEIIQPNKWGGKECPAKEHHHELKACNEQPCAEDCKLSEYTPWSSCTQTCSGGTQTRTRTITGQPAKGGKACPGPSGLLDTRRCNRACCKGEGIYETSKGECITCKVGDFAHRNLCKQCKPGTFNNKPGRDFCPKCKAASYADKLGMTVCTKCKAGRFALAAWSRSRNSCKDCPAGTGSKPGSIECTDCKAGTFSPGASKCIRCADGYSQPKPRQAKCDICKAGTYSNFKKGFLKCHICKAGTYSANMGENRCKNCKKGQHSRDEQKDCSTCPSGKFHAEPTSLTFLYEIGWHGQKCMPYEICGLGKELAGHTVTKNGKCLDCENHEYQSFPKKWDALCMQCGNCAKGNQRLECSIGSEGRCDVCKIGTFKNDVSYMPCDLCPKGKYAPKEEALECKFCPAGYIATEGAGKCTPCKAGKYNIKPNNHCDTCGAGTYSKDGAPKCKKCLKGSWSDKNSGTCTDCLAGTYGEGPTQDADYCDQCPDGKYQPVEGTVRCKNCLAGSHSKPAAKVRDSCIECTPGKAVNMPEQHKCPECQEGKFTLDYGRKKCDRCPRCPHRDHFRKDCGLAIAGSCTECPNGKFNQIWKCGAHEACPIGKFGAKHIEECHTCPYGKYKDEETTAECTKCGTCPAGHMRIGCTNSNAGTCVACGKGTYKSGPIDWDTSCLVCNKGSYADAPATRLCKTCPTGKFQRGKTALEAEECDECEAGKYGPSTGLLWCTICPLGKWQFAMAQPDCDACKKGHFNEKKGAKVDCKRCPKGKFHITKMVGDIEKDGRWAGTGLRCTSCTKGLYMPETAHFAAPNAPIPCFACAGGHYSGHAAPECKGCKAGKFETGSQTGCMHCPKGQFQEADHKMKCEYCESGFHMAYVGSTQCKKCRNPLPVSKPAWPVNRFWWTKNLAGALQCERKPLDCLPSPWHPWTTCTKTCGTGNQKRLRKKIHDGWGGGKHCREFEWNQERKCNSHECPIDCVITKWAPWGQCTAACGTGRQVRKRAIDIHPKHGGKACPKLVSANRACNTQVCVCKAMTCSYMEHKHTGQYSVHVNHGIGRLKDPTKYGFKKGQTHGMAADYFTRDGIHHCKYNKVTDKCTCTCPSIHSESYVNHLPEFKLADGTFKLPLHAWRPTNHNHAAWAAPGKVWPEWHALFHENGGHRGLGHRDKDNNLMHETTQEWRAYHVPGSSAYRERVEKSRPYYTSVDDPEMGYQNAKMKKDDNWLNADNKYTSLSEKYGHVKGDTHQHKKWNKKENWRNTFMHYGKDSDDQSTAFGSTRANYAAKMEGK